MSDEPKRFEQSQYVVELELSGTVNETVETTIVTRERPFVMTMITHCVVGEDGNDPEQYALDWSIQNEKRYWKGPATAPMAKAAFGSVKTGRWISFPQPIPIEAKTSLFVKVINRYAADQEDPRTIQVIFHGLEEAWS